MRTNDIQLPLIPIINELVQNNPDTISLGQGVVFYPPPEAITPSIISRKSNE